MVQDAREDVFGFIITHEFGHIIQDCDKGLLRLNAEFVDAHYLEGGVDHYANNARICGSNSNLQEDYAESLSYYLNPTTNLPTEVCTGAPFVRPDLKNKFPLHYNVISTIMGPF